MRLLKNKMVIASCCLLLIVTLTIYLTIAFFSERSLKATTPDPSQIQHVLHDYAGVSDEITYNYTIKLSLKDVAKHGPSYYVKKVVDFCMKNKKELIESPYKLEDYLDGIGELNPEEPSTHGKITIDLYL